MLDWEPLDTPAPRRRAGARVRVKPVGCHRRSVNKEKAEANMAKRLGVLLGGWLAVMLTGMADASDGHLERIATSGELRVCIWPDYYGISYRNPKTQTLSGIDIDMAGVLAADLGARPVFVDSSFARLIADLNEDRCDVAMFAVGMTPERQRQLSFTAPYLASDIYAIASKSNRLMTTWADIDRPGTVVAVAKGTLHESVMRERLTQAELRVLDTPHAREQEVASGRADVFMTDFPYSRRMLETTDWARLIRPDRPYHITPYAYAVRNGDAPWLERLERFVAAIKQDGRLREAARRHRLEPIVLTD